MSRDPSPASSLVVQLPERIEASDAPSVLRQISAGCSSSGASGPFVVDASPLRRFDSSALAALIELKRCCDAAGRLLDIRSAPDRLVRLAMTYGIATMLWPDPPSGTTA